VSLKNVVVKKQKYSKTQRWWIEKIDCTRVIGKKMLKIIELKLQKTMLPYRWWGFPQTELLKLKAISAERRTKVRGYWKERLKSNRSFHSKESRWIERSKSTYWIVYFRQTGVGKTQLAKVLAELFDSGRRSSHRHERVHGKICNFSFDASRICR
jgi:hypothetical protein